MTDTGGSVQALFAVAALIVGLCSHRFVTALKWSLVLGASCLMLFIVIALAVRYQSENPGVLAGYLAGASALNMLFASRPRNTGLPWVNSTKPARNCSAFSSAAKTTPKCNACGNASNAKPTSQAGDRALARVGNLSVG